MKKIVITLLVAYKRALSPVFESVFGNACRYTPTCGEYAMEAIEKHGVIRGATLALRRILSCHPYSKKYWDPVPERTNN